MYNESFTIAGKTVKVLLGGDFHFLYDQLGHQGAAAKYPSLYDKVDLEHLRKHGDAPHTPADCPVEKRSVDDYHWNYSANLADTRNNNDLHLNGKDHDSVCGQMLFPLRSLDQVVPASLHILLGVTLLLYNELLQICKGIDTEACEHKIQKEQAI